ncbi:GyrI-like domain-containing protein [Agromyces archimandritae]|uniref:GyrI-like domain-containing protein n=1 Tax=Agromyces archimandritae TaxID=2781962 RepID=A0A975FP97_9MICO|nr:GyrI-like domain-containing protein [Agromyces archimandritae]QTX05606.1 GyrI-like domain-containing protein [Agromyces archimandritae]
MGEAAFDATKDLREFYTARAGRFDLVVVPELPFLMLDGHGDPNTEPAYAAAVQGLYALSYRLKFTVKRELGRDAKVAPLEGLWSAADPRAFAARDTSAWDWTLMILQPPWITAELVDAARPAAAEKAPAAASARFETLTEGLSVQTLHRGPYDEEGPVLAELHEEFMPEHGLAFNGPHHEIYFGDPRRQAPERMRTILRQPVARTA